MTMPTDENPAAAPAGFPPGPRSWPGLVDDVICQMATLGPTAWMPIAHGTLGRPWVGAMVPDLEVPRAWVWDVVTPEDRADDASLRADPMALSVSQDLVLVEIGRGAHPAGRVRLQVPVTSCPESIDVPLSALPGPPWTVDLCTGWSTAAIDAAVDQWAVAHVGRQAVAPRPDDVMELTDRFEVGEGLFITGDAFDRLLRLDPSHAAVITGTFSAICEALEPYRT